MVTWYGDGSRERAVTTGEAPSLHRRKTSWDSDGVEVEKDTEGQKVTVTKLHAQLLQCF